MSDRRSATGARLSYLRLTVPVAPGASPRAALAAQAAFLIDLLDRIDPDPDLEEDALEPNLAGEAYGREPDLELDNADDEPSLGSPAGGIGNQERWAQGINAEENGDENDWNGDERDDDGDCRDYSGNGPSDDDPIFSDTAGGPALSAQETRKLSAFLRKRALAPEARL